MFACQKLLSVANLYTRRIDACCINSTLYMYITIDVSTIKWLLLAAGLQSVVGWKRKLHATVKFWLRVDAEIDSLCNCVCEICDILLNNNCQNMPKMKFVNISNIKKILILLTQVVFLFCFVVFFFASETGGSLPATQFSCSVLSRRETRMRKVSVLRITIIETELIAVYLIWATVTYLNFSAEEPTEEDENGSLGLAIVFHWNLGQSFI